MTVGRAGPAGGTTGRPVPADAATAPIPGALRGDRPNFALGLAVAAVSVAAATLAIYPLRHVAPVVSLSVVYLPAVLVVGTYWGLALGLATALVSAAAFNFFHLSPTGQFTIADSRNWVALAAFIVVTLASSTIAQLARTRAQEAERGRAEADLAAALARELLRGEDTPRALAAGARRVAEALGLRSAAIETGIVTPGPRRRAFPLRSADGSQIATLLVSDDLGDATEQNLETRVVPTLAALVAIAQHRDRLQSEAVETAALRRSDDLKTALLRAVSHDLRSPLTAVVAAGHALGTESLTEGERTELSRAVVQEGTRLATLVDKLLDLSRLQAGGAEPRPDWVSIEDLVAAAVEGLGERTEVRVVVDADVPEVRADATQLERAFANLLENAHRYSGGRPVSVHARRAADKVVVSFVDQGPGIPAAEIGRIFEPFYRGLRSAREPWTGSGLGLAIAKGFVEAQGGTIRVESLPGQGTSFLVSLPIAERPPAQTEDPGAPTEPAGAPTEPAPDAAPPVSR
jgi:two-component system sensor histidine kinase KdpD